MYECKSSGGHFFVHSPHMRSFVCQRCSTSFSNYNLPVPRTASSRLWYSTLVDKDRPKAPWRCIVESCAFTACEPCSIYIQAQLQRIQELGDTADLEAELAAVEKEGGRVGVVKPGEVGNGKEDREGRRGARKEAAAAAVVAAEEAEQAMEVDDNIDAEGGDDYSLEFLKSRPYTRSAALAGAAARLRGPARTVVRRERDPARREAKGD